MQQKTGTGNVTFVQDLYVSNEDKRTDKNIIVGLVV
jgi:hypothetical protein